MSEVNLPEGWAQTVISDIADINPKKIEAEPEALSGFVPMSHAPTDFNGTLSFEEKPWGEIKKSYTNFQDHDVIVAKVTPCFENGKAAIVKGLPNGIGAGSSEFYVLRPAIKEVSTRFLFSIVKSHKFLQEGAANMTGAVGLRRVPRAFVEAFPIALPPLAEQKVIADKLDTLLAQLETSKARLDRIPQILKTFRQSVLAAAVSGKLTEEWRKDKRLNVSNELKQIHKSRDELYQKDNKKHFDKTGKNLRKYDYSTLNEEPVVRAIPEGWELVKLGEIVSFLTDYHANGSYEVLKEHVELKETEDYACMIRATNFEKNNFYDLFVYISEEAYEFLEKSKLYGNEILIGKIGNAGSVYLMPKLDKPASLAMNLFALRFDEKLVNPNYIYMFLNSSLGEANIQKYVRGVATKSIDKKSVRSVFINYPSFEEQTQIVRRVEELFAFADRIEQKANAALERVNNLTQSILAKAFRGELTADWRAQNPDLISGDNSAEALLEKIKAEREALSSKKKPKKKIAARKKA